MLKVRVESERVYVGERFSVSLQRTLRIPEDDQTYPLPPSLGAFPIHCARDFPERMPQSWLESDHLFIAMYQREALWLGFGGADWKPNAVKVRIGGVNAVSGDLWEEGLHTDPQDYIVCPDQPWLDGINAGEGFIKQFVAMPLGQGYTVEAQVTGREEVGGIQLIVYEPKPGRFPDQPPPEVDTPSALHTEEALLGGEMGLGAGGRITQKIYPDQYGVESWDTGRLAHLFIHILNSEQYHELTGLEPPSSPVSAETYAEYKLPWFELYDESKADLAASSELAKIRSVGQKDGEEANTEQKRIEVERLPVWKLGRPSDDQK